MKKVLLVGSLLLASTASLANSLFHGAYVGVGAGAAIAHHTKNSFVWSDINPNFSQSFNPNLSRYAATLDFLAGYAWKIQCWHLGAEVDYLFGNINTKFNQTGFPGLAPINNAFVAVNSSGAWGGGIRMGYHWDRILGFVRLGLENRRFKISSSLIGNGTPLQIARNTLSSSINRTAFAPGIGVQVSLNKNISATLEYRIALYRQIKKELKTVDGTTSLKIDPRVSTLLASFRYHF